MAISVKNNAYSTLAGSIASGDLTITVQSGHGARFPTLSGDYFYAALQDASNNYEIVKVTARATDAMTVVRAQEGTTAKAFSAGTAFELRLTAQTLTDLIAALGVASANFGTQLFQYFTSGGTSTAYTLTPSPALSALAAGNRFNVAFHTAAGTTPTLAVSGLTAKSLKYKDSTGTKQAVTSTQIPANWFADVEYDGTDWVVMNIPPASSSVALGTVVTSFQQFQGL